KQPAKAKSSSDPSEAARTEAQQLKIVLRRSRQQTHISQLGVFGTDEGTGSKLGVPDVPTDESEEELSWNSYDDEGANDQEKVGDDDEGDEGNDSEEGEDDEDKNSDEIDNDDQEVAKHDDKDDTEESGDVDKEGESDEEDDNEETRDEESFDPIPQTPESSEDEGNGEEDQGLRINEEERLNEEEEAEELYRDININQGRGIQASLDVEDSHVTLTPVHLDGQLKSLEANFSEYRQTNPFAEDVSNILGIVHQYINQQINEAVRVAFQIQTDRLHYSYHRENDEFLQTIDENMKRIIKEQVKGQVKEQVS
nr:hypothetical protein [Tanacetum cinerariifolium]